MATITIGGTYLMTHGNDKFMNYWYSDYEKPKDTIAAMRYGQRDDIKGEYDELKKLRKINVQPLFQKKTLTADEKTS